MNSVPSIASELNSLFPAEWLRRTARTSGAVQRFVKVDIVVLFWALMLAPGSGAFASLAALQRRFRVASGFKLATSSFLKRFSPALVTFLDACFRRAVNHAIEPMVRPAIFRRYKDVLAIDSSLITLADSLAAVFPGPRNNNTPAAAKVNAVYSVLSASIRSLSIFKGTKAETKCLAITKKIEGMLLMFDLGYFSFPIFAKIDRVGGFFISRLKKNAKPRIVADHLTGPGRRRPLVGMKIWDAVKGLGREVIDVEVETTFNEKRRPTKTKPRKTTRRTVRFRVVGVRHPDTGELHLYITNVGRAVMSPDQVRVAYSGRWMVELLFYEMKHCCEMKRLPSERAEVVRSLILCSAIRLAVSRAALGYLRTRAMAAVRGQYAEDIAGFIEERLALRIVTRRFITVWHEYSLLLLPEVLKCAGLPWDFGSLDLLLFAAAFDTNRNRDSLTRRLVEA